MTEQPVETEQQFLGNETLHVNSHHPSASALLDCTGGQLCPAREHLEGCYAPAFQTKAASLVQPREHYSPNAHLRRPAWSPVDNVELGALARKSCQAAKLLAIAKDESVKAEEALQLALGVEHEAESQLFEAENAVREFLRKDSGL